MVSGREGERFRLELWYVVRVGARVRARVGVRVRAKITNGKTVGCKRELKWSH